MDELTTTESILITFASISASLISILGSSLILMVLLRSKDRLGTSYRRLMCGISIIDIIFSLAYIVGDLPAPKGTPGALFAYGNVTTCNIQGFLFFVGYSGSSFYVTSLCIFYFLTIGCNISHKKIALKAEPFLHLIPTVYLLASGSYLMATGHFNFAGKLCWIAPKPLNCINDDNVECIRGEHAFRYRWVFQGYFIYANIIIIFACMFGTVHAVYIPWAKMGRYSLKTGANKKQRSSLSKNSQQYILNASQYVVSEAMMQAFMYFGAFFLTVSVAFINQVIRQNTGKHIYVLWLLGNTMLPLQGFFNFLVFMRPRVASIKFIHPNMPFLQRLWQALTTREGISKGTRTRQNYSNIIQTEDVVAYKAYYNYTQSLDAKDVEEERVFMSGQEFHPNEESLRHDIDDVLSSKSSRRNEFFVEARKRQDYADINLKEHVAADNASSKYTQSCVQTSYSPTKDIEKDEISVSLDEFHPMEVPTEEKCSQKDNDDFVHNY